MTTVEANDVERMAEALFEFAYGPDTLDWDLQKHFKSKLKKAEIPPVWPNIPAAERYRSMARYVVEAMQRETSIAGRYTK